MKNFKIKDEKRKVTAEVRHFILGRRKEEERYVRGALTSYELLMI